MTKNITAAEIVTTLTAKGTETMKAVGLGQLSFFDDGVVEGSGIWGEILTAEMSHKSSGVLNRLKDLDLWETSEDFEANAGDWWALTALGAEVALLLAGVETDTPLEIPEAVEVETETVEEIPEVEVETENFIPAIRAMAEKFSYRNGWDILIESISDDEIREIVGSASTERAAIMRARKHCRVLDSHRAA